MPTQSTGRWKAHGGAGRPVGGYTREGEWEEKEGDKQVEKEDEEGGRHILTYW